MTPAARETSSAIVSSPISSAAGLAPNALTTPVSARAVAKASKAVPSPLEARRRRQSRWAARS